MLMLCTPSPQASSCSQEERTGEPLDPELQWMMEGGPGLREDGSDNFQVLLACFVSCHDRCVAQQIAAACTCCIPQACFASYHDRGVDTLPRYLRMLLDALLLIKVMQGVWDCDEAQGVGERHVKMMPRAPHYEVCCLGSDAD